MGRFQTLCPISNCKIRIDPLEWCLIVTFLYIKNVLSTFQRKTKFSHCIGKYVISSLPIIFFVLENSNEKLSAIPISANTQNVWYELNYYGLFAIKVIDEASNAPSSLGHGSATKFCGLSGAT